MILNSPYISGSLTVTGNTNLMGTLTVTGSLSGTASFATNATNAVNATNALSASSVLPLSQSVIITGSLLITGSLRSTAELRAPNLSFSTEIATNGGEIRVSQTQFKFGNNIKLDWSETTDSNGTKDLGIRRNNTGSLEIYDGNTAGNRRDLTLRNITGSNAFFSSSLIVSGSSSVTGSLNVSGSITTSGTITAQTLVVQTVTSSIVYSSGSNIFGNALTNTQTFTGSMFVTGSGTFTSTISAIGESTLFRGVFNDPVPNTAAVLKMSSTPTPSALSTVVGARMTGNATANFDSYAGYFSNLTVSSGTGLSYGIFATASFHTFIGETRLAQGVFNDPIAGTAASVKISATPVSGYPTAVFTAGATGAASSNQNTYAGYFTNTTTVSGTGVNYGIYATGSSHYLGGNVGIGTTSPSAKLDVRTDTGVLIKGATSNSDAILSFLPTTGGRQYDFRNFGSSFAILDSSANITRMYFNFSGNTGIGLTNPSALLHISGSGSGSLMQISSHVSSNIFFVSGSGNIGIGTTTPTEKFDVIGGAVAAGNGTIRTGITYSTLGLIGTFTNHDLGVITNGTTKMTILSGGNVGIGTTSPTYKLQVSDGTRVVGFDFTQSLYPVIKATTVLRVYQRTEFWGSADGYYIDVRDASGNPQVYFSGASANNYINSGNVGIGTTSPSQVLHVSNASNYVGALINGSNAPQLCFAQGSGTSPNWKVGISGNDGNAFSISSGSINADKLVILRNGNVGIGTFAPAYTLDVSGTVRCQSPLRISNESTYGITFTAAGGSAGNTILADGGQGLVLGGNGTTALTFSYNSTTATFAGAVSKASGTFKIDHPLESLSETHQLVHSFIEGPRVDLIYRGTVNLVSGSAIINIDQTSGMTEGTFVVLNRETQVFTTNETSWDAVKGNIEGNILTITSQNSESTDKISWMVIGERQDKHIKDTDWTDSNGKPILEPLKELENN